LEESQIGLMYELRNYYKDFVILLDRGQVAESLVLEEKLHFLPGVRSKFITEAKDPGDLTPEQSIRLIEEA